MSKIVFYLKIPMNHNRLASDIIDERKNPKKKVCVGAYAPTHTFFFGYSSLAVIVRKILIQERNSPDECVSRIGMAWVGVRPR